LPTVGKVPIGKYNIIKRIQTGARNGFIGFFKIRDRGDLSPTLKLGSYGVLTNT
jgi:hypothetical protein